MESHPKSLEIISIQDIDNRLSDHFIDDGVRFKSIDDKQDATLVMLNEQNKIMKAHIEKVEPYLQGAAGFGILWKLFVGVGGAVLIWLQIKDFIFSK